MRRERLIWVGLDTLFNGIVTWYSFTQQFIHLRVWSSSDLSGLEKWSWLSKRCIRVATPKKQNEPMHVSDTLGFFRHELASRSMTVSLRGKICCQHMRALSHVNTVVCMLGILQPWNSISFKAQVGSFRKLIVTGLGVWIPNLSSPPRVITTVRRH